MLAKESRPERYLFLLSRPSKDFPIEKMADLTSAVTL